MSFSHIFIHLYIKIWSSLQIHVLYNSYIVYVHVPLWNQITKYLCNMEMDQVLHT